MQSGVRTLGLGSVPRVPHGEVREGGEAELLGHWTPGPAPLCGEAL